MDRAIGRVAHLDYNRAKHVHSSSISPFLSNPRRRRSLALGPESHLGERKQQEGLRDGHDERRRSQQGALPHLTRFSGRWPQRFRIGTPSERGVATADE